MCPPGTSRNQTMEIPSGPSGGTINLPHKEPAGKEGFST